MQEKLDVTLQKKKRANDTIENLDIRPFELSLVKEGNPQLNANLHLLPDQNLDHGLHMRVSSLIFLIQTNKMTGRNIFLINFMYL